MIINSVASYLKSVKPSSLKNQNSVSNPFKAPMNGLTADTVSFSGMPAVDYPQLTKENKKNVIRALYKTELRKSDNYLLRAKIAMEPDEAIKNNLVAQLEANEEDIRLYRQFLSDMTGERDAKKFVLEEFKNDNMVKFYILVMHVFNRQAEKLTAQMEKHDFFDEEEMQMTLKHVEQTKEDSDRNTERLYKEMSAKYKRGR